MKKLILIIFPIMFILTACGVLRVTDVSRLSPGMTQIEVDRILGNPVRILSSSYIQEGEINVYEYITYRNESYAVEFLNGRLNRYDFMYENVPPAIIEPNPTPVYPAYPVHPSQPIRPSQPVRPSRPERPATRPTETNRPNSSTTKPESSRPATRPSGTTSTGRPATRTTTETNSEEKANEPNKQPIAE